MSDISQNVGHLFLWYVRHSGGMSELQRKCMSDINKKCLNIFSICQTFTENMFKHSPENVYIMTYFMSDIQHNMSDIFLLIQLRLRDFACSANSAAYRISVFDFILRSLTRHCTNTYTGSFPHATFF